MEPPDGVDQDVEDEVLRGRDVNLAHAIFAGEEAAQLVGPLEERDRVRQEPLPVRRQRPPAARPPALAVQLDPQPRLQRQQPVAHALLGDEQPVGRLAEATRPRQLDERRDLIGGKREGGIRHG